MRVDPKQVHGAGGVGVSRAAERGDGVLVGRGADRRLQAVSAEPDGPPWAAGEEYRREYAWLRDPPAHDADG